MGRKAGRQDGGPKIRRGGGVILIEHLSARHYIHYITKSQSHPLKQAFTFPLFTDERTNTQRESNWSSASSLFSRSFLSVYCVRGTVLGTETQQKRR